MRTKARVRLGRKSVSAGAPKLGATGGEQRAAQPAARARRNTLGPRLALALVPPAETAGIGEEEAIESSKYLPVGPVRLFEEERFLFPESYGASRVRLLVKDPDWVFAYWDLDHRDLERLRASVGERVVALSRLTLRVQDPGSGGGLAILVPVGARSWYVRTDSAQRAYRAELGLTLPSGEFRSFATSNTASVPRRAVSTQRARRVVSWKRAHEAAQPDPDVQPSVPTAEPWRPVERSRGSERSLLPGPERGDPAIGGASDLYNRH